MTKIDLNDKELEIHNKIKNREFIFGGVWPGYKDMKKFWQENGKFYGTLDKYPELFIYLWKLKDYSSQWNNEFEKNVKFRKKIADLENALINEARKRIKLKKAEAEREREREELSFSVKYWA